jgi:hypothetical protein
MAKMAYLIGAAVAGTAFIAATAWYSNRSTVLSQEPIRKGVAEAAPTSESTLGVRVGVPFGVLNSAVNGLLPATITKDENGEDACLFRICAGTHYKFTASRSPIAFSHENGSLRAAVSLAIEGKGGFRGDGAKLVGLDAKNFDAAADVAVVASVSITPGWCPEVDASVSYNWTKTPRVEYISGKYVSIGGIAEKAINDSLKTLPDKLKEAMPCAAIKAAAAKVWRNYSVPVQVPDGPMLHVAIHPKQVGTSGLIVTDENLRIAIGVVSDVSVSTKADPEQPLGSLPDLGQVPDSAGKLDVSLPLRAEYGPLNEALLATVRGKPFEFGAGSGKGTVEIKDVEVFPNDGKVGLKLAFTADLPGRIFNTSGVVYATARVTPDETDQVIRLTDFSYSRILDNGIWSGLSAVFEGQIRQQVENNGRIDLKPHLDKGREALRDAVSDPTKTNGVKIEVGNPDAKIISITPADDHLAILTRITGTLDTTVIDPTIAN